MASVNPVQIEKYLRGVDFPAGKNDVIQCAEDNEAPDEVLSALNRLGDYQYNSPVDITKEVGRWH